MKARLAAFALFSVLALSSCNFQDMDPPGTGNGVDSQHMQIIASSGAYVVIPRNSVTKVDARLYDASEHKLLYSPNAEALLAPIALNAPLTGTPQNATTEGDITIDYQLQDQTTGSKYLTIMNNTLGSYLVDSSHGVYYKSSVPLDSHWLDSLSEE